MMDSHNYKLLETLLKRPGTDVLRQIFRTRYLMLTSSDWQDSSKCKVARAFLKHQAELGSVAAGQWDRMKTVKLSNFNLPLLTKLILQMDPSQNQAYAYSAVVQIQDQIHIENIYIQDLEAFHNNLKDLPMKTLVERNFEKLFSDLEEILFKLGVPQEYFDEFLEIPQDPTEQKSKLDEQNSNSYRHLMDLLFKMGSQRMRAIFSRRYRMMTNQDWEDESKEANREFLEDLIQTHALDILKGQQRMIEAAKLKKFDFHLLANLIPAIQCPSWDLEAEKDLSYQDFKIRQLEILRNKFTQELKEGAVNYKRFKRYCIKVRRILLKLEVRKDVIDQVFNEFTTDSSTRISEE